MGELERKVFDRAKDLVTIDWKNHHWFFEAERFSNIIDEARKEFPLDVLQVSTEEMDKLECGKLLKNAKIVASKLEPLGKWFLKWFGDY
jgi:hypothetical protein